jgi:Ser/Thr protein kinase RdoA (MazF antagonist)
MPGNLSSIANHFFPINEWVSETSIGAGNINDTYCIEFISSGNYHKLILQRLNHEIFRKPALVMENIHHVTAYLQKHSFEYYSPAPLRTLDGNLLFQDNQGNCWRCFPFVENSYAPEGKASAEVAYEAAKAYGAFSRALQDFPVGALYETIPGFHDTDQRWQTFIQILEKDPVGRRNNSKAEIDAIFLAKPVFDSISQLKASGKLPLRVTHNDTKAGNVLLHTQTQKAMAVIDLDTVMPGTILSDFGDMVRSFVPVQVEDSEEEIQLQQDVLGALERGFLSETSNFLTTTERDNLLLGGLWIIGEQALRFLSDWLAGDTYYKVKHPLHNLVRARNQLRVLKKLQAIV